MKYDIDLVDLFLFLRQYEATTRDGQEVDNDKEMKQRGPCSSCMDIIGVIKTVWGVGG